MSKHYYQPKIESTYIVAMKMLCSSGDVDSGINSNGTGENPWEYGRAPRRTKVF